MTAPSLAVGSTGRRPVIRRLPAIWIVVAVSVTAAVAVIVAITAGAASSSPDSVTAVPEPARLAAPLTQPCNSPDAIQVADTGALTTALAAAGPGTQIRLAAGVYLGRFVARTDGTPTRPIVLCGPRDAVLNGGEIDGGYALHLDGASHWQLSGFTIRGGQKGLMADDAQANLIEGLLIEGTGDEGLHLRTASRDNVVRGNEIRRTGLRTAKFGEGIYIGSARSNWCDYTACGPDRSDRNVVEGNVVSATTAESVDIKEGTTGGVLRGNTFSGAGAAEADSWVDVKGNGWTIADNVGTDSSADGYQLHKILTGWGLDNTFSGNASTVNGPGYGINITKNAGQNRVTCTNTAVNAAKGLSNIPCV